MESISVEICVVGNELLRGEIQDTNTRFICRLVNSRGGMVTRAIMLPDIEETIARAVVATCSRQADLLVVSGGLGPTEDDLTLAAVARGVGVELRLDDTARRMVRERYDDFHSRGILAEGGLNPFREKMAWLPAGSRPLDNPVGTAPGVLLQAGRTAIVCLPGVPGELEAILSGSLTDLLDQLFGAGGSFARTLTVRCNDESIMAPGMRQVTARFPQVYIKSLARMLGEVPELDILFTMTGGTALERQTLVDDAFAAAQREMTALGLSHREKLP